jgi:Mg/Co/Ni transporter MgtE
VGKLVNLVKEHWEYESADVVLGFMARVKFKKNVWRSVTENEALQLIDSLQDDKKRKTVKKMVQEERQKNMDAVNNNAKKAIESMNGNSK